MSPDCGYTLQLEGTGGRMDLPDATAVGLEQEAIEIENQLEWAEAQGRSDDAVELREELAGKLDELAVVVEETLSHPAPTIDATHAA
jgi:hypothetical protein